MRVLQYDSGGIALHFVWRLPDLYFQFGKIQGKYVFFSNNRKCKREKGFDWVMAGMKGG